MLEMRRLDGTERNWFCSFKALDREIDGLRSIREYFSYLGIGEE